MSAEYRCDFSSLALSRLRELARRTKRYNICKREPDQFEVFDERCWLDNLVRLPELRPTDASLQIEFDEALEQMSSGPLLSEADNGMLIQLSTSVEVLDPQGENSAFNAAYQRAVVLRGTLGHIEYFLCAALEHRVH